MWIQTLGEYFVYLVALFLMVGNSVGAFMITTPWGFAIPILLSLPLLFVVLSGLKVGSLPEDEETTAPFLWTVILFFAGSLVSFVAPGGSLFVAFLIVLLVTWIQTALTSEEQMEETTLSGYMKSYSRGSLDKNPIKTVIAFILSASFLLFLPPFGHSLIGLVYWGTLLALTIWTYEKRQGIK